ncbi:TonB-dependent receptor [Methylomonas sp. AM2-LC]|uniref:TonB-dependent siderophore receptor n=1 Tax=Methylomonas sp. AM2-LC TaxID=3153301 RepID=UPI0032651472
MSPHFPRFIPICLTAIPVLIATPLCAAETLIGFNIGAQSLADALLEFSQTSGLKIFYSAEMTKNIKTSGLNGKYTAQQGLQKLLNDTGLQYKYTDKETVTIENAPATPQSNQADPTTLPKVNVVGTAVYNVKDPYNEDYVLPNATAGTKTDTPIMETPLNVQVISKQVLKDQQVITLGDSLKNVSGVSLNSSSIGQGWDTGVNQSIVMRGFASDTYFRNGFRLQQGSDTREMANVESVEVLKGSAAILYGLVEPGGMVNVITKQPLATPYYAVNQQFGSYDLYRTTVDATGPVTDNKDVLYRINMSYQNSGSFRDYVNNEKFYIAPIVKWNISPRTQVTGELEYSHDNLGLDNSAVPLLNNQFMYTPINRNYGAPAPKKLDNIFGGANWSHQFNDDWSIKHSMSVNHSNSNALGISVLAPLLATYFVPGAPADQMALGLFQNNATNNTYATNMDLTGHFDTAWLKHTLLLGGDYYRVDTANSQGSSLYNFVGNNILNPTPCATITCGLSIDPQSPYTTPASNTQTDQYGLYLQDQIKLPYDVHVTGGFRYQNIHQGFNVTRNNLVSYTGPSLSADAVTPRVGLLWQPQKWLSLYSNYTENFGANGGGLLVYVNDTTSKQAGPTSSQQWEVGFKNEFFGGRLRSTFAYYNLTKQNVASADPNQLHVCGGGGCSQLTGEVRSRGPELDIQGEILPGWNAIATYANTDIIVTKTGTSDYPAVGSRYWGVPRNTASLWNTYDFQQDPLKGFKVGGGVTLRDGTLAQSIGRDNTAPTTAGYATVDLLAAYSLKLGNKSKVSVQFNINNLLDKLYYTSAATYSSTDSTSVGYNSGIAAYGVPRTFMGSIRVEF